MKERILTRRVLSNIMVPILIVISINIGGVIIAEASLSFLGFGLPVGIYSAIRQDTDADYLGRSIAVIGLATPNFRLGIMVMIFPAIWWGWTPPLEWVPFTEDPLGNLWGLFFPSLILGTASSAATMRMMRTMMLEVLRQDYIRTAWSKGLKERVVIIRHTLKNALIPVVMRSAGLIGRAAAGPASLRSAVADPGRGRGDHGEHLQPAGDRASPGECPQ